MTTDIGTPPLASPGGLAPRSPIAARGGIGLLLVLVASSGVQISAALSQTLFDRLDPFGVSGLRFAVAAACMLLIVRPRLCRRSRGEWATIALYGGSIAAMNVCMYRALVHLPLGVAITLEFLGPFAVAVLASRRPRQAVFAVLGLVGVVIIARPSADLDPVGLIFGGLAAFSLAGYVVVAERIGRAGGGGSELALAFGVAALLTSPFAVAAAPSLRWTDAPVLGLSALLGVILAFTADFLAVKAAGARTVAVMLSLDPVLAAVIGAVALGERLDALTVAGMVCVAIAGGLAAFADGGARMLREPNSPLMPHEGAPQARTWLAWPTARYMLNGTYAPAEEVWTAWAAVANAISEFQPVSILVHTKDRKRARRLLSATVEQHSAPIDDAWMRDSGPTFVRDGAAGRLAAVSWVFNAWGGLALAETARDDRVAERVAALAGAPVMHSDLVNEGGGIHVDGSGTVLATETVQLDPRRNPGRTKAGVERELSRTLGARRVIWLPRGLHRDYGPLGTRGHVDMVAAFSEPGVLLLHAQRDPAHPDHRLTARLKRQLEHELDASGRRLAVIDLPAPRTLRDREGWVDYTYANHALVNGAVIACAFDDPADERAAGILADAYRGREVVSIDARAIFALGGGIHCITQQQPAV